jgi:hypothetical protein
MLNMLRDDYVENCPDGTPHDFRNAPDEGRLGGGYSVWGMSYVLKCSKCGQIQVIDTSG